MLLTAAIWGFAFVVVKDSLDYIGPVWMIAFRFTIATVALALLYAKKLRRLTRRAWFHGALLGFYLFLAYLVQTIGCNYTTAGKNAFLTTTYVFFVPLLSWPLSKKRPALHVFACALLSLTGIAMLALGTGSGAGSAVGSSLVNIGDILTLICGVFYAVHIIFTAKYDQEHDPVLLTVLQFLFAALFAWLSAPLFDGALPLARALSSRVIVSVLYLGLFSTMIAFVLQNVGLKYLPSAWTALLMSFESAFGVLFSVLILHEQLTLRMGAGCLLIFAALVLAQVLPERNRAA